MALPQVVVEVDRKSRVVLREGRVLDRKGVEATVQWGDGSTDEVRLVATDDRMMLSMPAGGLRHRKLIDPAGVSELVRSSPAQAFELALLDSSKPMSSRDLIARVEEVFDGDVSALWKRARQTFEANESVKASGKGATLKYTWVGQPQPDAVAAGVAAQGDEPTGANEDTTIVGLDAGNAVPRADAALHVTNGVGESVLSGDPNIGRGSAHRTEREQIHPVAELVHRTAVSGQLPEDASYLLPRALGSPLAAGLALEALPEDSLRMATPLLGRAGLILLAVPKSSKTIKSIDAVALAGPHAAKALLNSANAELSASEPRSWPTQELQRAHGFLVRRILASPSVDLVGLETVLRAARDLGAQSEASRETELIAEALAAVIDSMSPASWPGLSLNAKSAIARRLVPAALRPKSPRARVLTWLWRNHPAELAEDMWWRRVDFEDLAGVAATPLGSALESEAIAASVVRPLVSARVESATTRRQLFATLAAPPPLARLIDHQAVQQAFERVLRQDDIARPWLVGLRNEDRISDLLRQVDALTQRALESDARAASDREAADAAEQRLLRTEARLAEAAASTKELRESQSRQIRIDAMRALARLCAYIDGAANSQPAERIRQRVRQIAAREGLIPVGEPGQPEPYDPHRHDVVGEAPQPETPVTVTGIGYTWGEGAGEMVLVRALVERSQ